MATPRSAAAFDAMQLRALAPRKSTSVSPSRRRAGRSSFTVADLRVLRRLGGLEDVAGDGHCDGQLMRAVTAPKVARSLIVDLKFDCVVIPLPAPLVPPTKCRPSLLAPAWSSRATFTS